MVRLVASFAPLLFGVFLLATGHGFLSTLLSVRLSVAGYTGEIAGLVMSCFYLGLIAGSFWAKGFISYVGHIRYLVLIMTVFAAVAFLHSLFMSPWLWGVLRLVGGFCMAGSFVAVESWLNAKADNTQRGKLLAVYIMIAYLSVGSGQKLLTIGDITDVQLFWLAGALIAFSVIPVLLTRIPPPPPPSHQRINIGLLLRSSPLGMSGAIVSGILLGAFYSVLPRYGDKVGLDTEGISLLMQCGFFGGMLFQLPVGWISDRCGRRSVITAVSIGLGFFSAILTVATVTASDPTVFTSVSFLSAVFLFGGLLFVVLPLSISCANDRADSQSFESTAGTLNLLNAAGSWAGALIVSIFMDFIGPQGFFVSTALCALLMVLLCIWNRTAEGQEKHQEESGTADSLYYLPSDPEEQHAEEGHAR